MEFNILMYIMLILSHVIFISLLLAIFTSVYMKNRKKGYVFLTIYTLLSIYSLNTVFKVSMLLGIFILVIYICLGVATYFVIKKKRPKRIEI